MSGIHRLSVDGFERPKITYTDTLQNKQAIQQKLDGFVEVPEDEIDNLDEGSFLRYLKYDTKTKREKFVTGGVLLRVYPKFLVIKGKGDGTFSAQRFIEKKDGTFYPTRFFKKLNNEEKLKMQLIEMQKKANEIITELEETIEKQQSEINELKNYIRKGKK